MSYEYYFVIAFILSFNAVIFIKYNSILFQSVIFIISFLIFTQLITNFDLILSPFLQILFLLVQLVFLIQTVFKSNYQNKNKNKNN